MKKSFIISSLFALALCFNSCASVFGGKIAECQKHKPENETRKLRPFPMVVGVLFPVSLIVDFSTGAIYKPCVDKK